MGLSARDFACSPVPRTGCAAKMVRAEGLEPPHLSILEPKSSASTNSATRARPKKRGPITGRATGATHGIEQLAGAGRRLACKEHSMQQQPPPEQPSPPIPQPAQPVMPPAETPPSGPDVDVPSPGAPRPSGPVSPVG